MGRGLGWVGRKAWLEQEGRGPGPGPGGWSRRGRQRHGEQTWQASLLATRPGLGRGPFRGRGSKPPCGVCLPLTFALACARPSRWPSPLPGGHGSQETLLQWPEQLGGHSEPLAGLWWGRRQGSHHLPLSVSPAGPAGWVARGGAPAGLGGFPGPMSSWGLALRVCGLGGEVVRARRRETRRPAYVGATGGGPVRVLCWLTQAPSGPHSPLAGLGGGRRRGSGSQLETQGEGEAQRGRRGSPWLRVRSGGAQGSREAILGEGLGHWVIWKVLLGGHLWQHVNPRLLWGLLLCQGSLEAPGGPAVSSKATRLRPRFLASPPLACCFLGTLGQAWAILWGCP